MEKISPNDPRYKDLVEKRFNKRYTGKPEYIRIPTSTQEVVGALQEAVNANRRPVVRSGGHCLEGFVADPEAQVLIDMSLMTGIHYDPAMASFMIEAGATVGEMYRRLFLGWGVVFPAGEHPGIGIGGHVPGDAFGFLCREYGLAADHLYAIELVAVDRTGNAYSIIATRETDDPNRELWWAHTGGGGNFGIVTRYWLRSPDSTGSDPYSTLPKAPASLHTFRLSLNWKGFDERSFSQLAGNFGTWCLHNSSPGSPFTQLFSILFLNHRKVGKLEIKGLATGSNATQLIEEHLAAIVAPLGLPFTKEIEESPWLRFALNPFPELFQPGFDNVKVKVKDAFFRQPLTANQIATAYKYLTEEGKIGGTFGLATYGGKVNTVHSSHTASAPSIEWVRNFYKDLFRETGGVPIPNDQTDGAMINHPDTDLADAKWNRSGVPWHTLYYKENYPALQQVKAKWDPLNIFHHALSIRI